MTSLRNNESNLVVNAAPIRVNESKVWLGHELRFGRDEDNNIWFVLHDLCKALGIKNNSNVAARLKKDHNLSVRSMEVQNARGQMRKSTIVFEDIVYT